MRHPRHRRPAARRGLALIDAIIGGVMLGIGLSVILTVSGRSLARQTDGEKRVVASWLADELLSMVLVEGPDQYSRTNNTSGRFGAPFDEYGYDVDIDSLGRGAPYRVMATVTWSEHPADVIQVESLIALRVVRPEDPEPIREPFEPVDREERYFEDEFGDS
ncbi:MAG: hypothetical protein HKO59_00230 [Phycisphaerales bacterium]|nr:hypothetical protein [Phycisphaerae bacterium]NNF44519.1 hypothetical protein [Phycisphaerales bacterium]NNM24408.1 hypothetical protein [Phycisphaerales bacterium]